VTKCYYVQYTTNFVVDFEILKKLVGFQIRISYPNKSITTWSVCVT